MGSRPQALHLRGREGAGPGLRRTQCPPVLGPSSQAGRKEATTGPALNFTPPLLEPILHSSLPLCANMSSPSRPNCHQDSPNTQTCCCPAARLDSATVIGAHPAGQPRAHPACAPRMLGALTQASLSWPPQGGYAPTGCYLAGSQGPIVGLKRH